MSENRNREEELPALWLVSLRLETNSPDHLNPGENTLEKEIARLQKDLRTKFKCKQIAHSTTRLRQHVSKTQLWLIPSKKAKEEIEKSREQLTTKNNGDGYCSSVNIFPIVTSKEGCEALEWLAEKRERSRNNHCRACVSNR